MKKIFTTMLGALLLAGTATAGVSTEAARFPGVDGFTTLTEHASLNGMSLMAKGSSMAAMDAPARVGEFTDVIYDAPGTVKYMYKNAGGYILYNDAVTEYSADFATKFVYGENGDVYIFNPITMQAADTYIKGTREGDKIVVSLPQTILKDNIGTSAAPRWEGYNLAVMKPAQITNPDGTQGMTYVVNEDKKSVWYEISSDGSVSLQGLDMGEILGLSTTTDGMWIGYGDYSQSFNPYDRETVPLPENVKLENYALVIGTTGFMVKVGFDGDDVYFVGLIPSIPDGVIKATIKDNVASIEQNQFVGIYNNRSFVTTRCGEFERKGSTNVKFADGTYDLAFDPDTKTFTYVDPDLLLVFNSEETKMSPVLWYRYVFFRGQESMEGTPSDPYNLKWDKYWLDIRGFYSFIFNMGNVSTTGNVLDFDNIYYSIYIDDEIMEFSREEGYYPGIPEDEIWDEIPCAFSNGYDIMSTGTTAEVGIFPDGVTTVGVQLVYYNGKQRTTSDILTLNLETGRVTGDLSLPDAPGVKSVVYYDLQGRRVENPSCGIFIKHATMQDGSVTVSKIIRK